MAPQYRPFVTLSLVLIVTTVVVFFSGWRLRQQGSWMPPLPQEVGDVWTSSELPLSQSALMRLGNPQTSGRRFLNAFNERVETHLIATRSFDAYQEPAILLSGYGYGITAEKIIPFFGKKGPVRAMVLRNGANGQRVLMYYWIQYRDGTTSVRGSLRDYRDVFPRLRLGTEAVVRGEQNCIVRVYTQVHPADDKGVQARRNLNQVSLAIYQTMTGAKTDTSRQTGSL